MLNVFQSEFIAANALEFIRLLASSNTEGISKGHLFRVLGISVSNCPPLSAHRLQFLNDSFDTIDTFTDPTEYINCIETWAQFIAENFSVSTKETLNKYICK